MDIKKVNSRLPIEYFVLENGLVVYLYDIMGMNIFVDLMLPIGSNHNTFDYKGKKVKVEGLAHLLEHLTLSCDNREDNSCFQTYVSGNNGYYNALTGNYHTQYNYMINYTKFDESIRLFSDLFMKIKITKKMLEEEINAVNSEYINTQYNIYESIRNVNIETIYDKDHPFCQNTCGNEKTLNIPNIGEYAEYFHNNYYSSHAMTLFVCLNPSLYDKKKMVEIIKSYFSKIPKKNNNPIKTKINKNVINDHKCIYIKSETENKMIITYNFNNDISDNVLSNYIGYFGHYMNIENKKSLIDYLKKCNYITSFYNSLEMKNGFYEIVMDLTDEGLKKISEITSIINNYIKKTSENLDKPFFSRLYKYKNINQNGPTRSVVDYMISNYIYYDDFAYEDIYKVGIPQKEFDKKYINKLSEFIGQLNEKNMNITICSLRDDYNSKAHHFNIEYKVTKLPSLKKDESINIYKKFLYLKFHDQINVNGDGFLVSIDNSKNYRFNLLPLNIKDVHVYIDFFLFDIDNKKDKYYLTLFIQYIYYKLKYIILTFTDYVLEMNFVNNTIMVNIIGPYDYIKTLTKTIIKLLSETLIQNKKIFGMMKDRIIYECSKNISIHPLDQINKFENILTDDISFNLSSEKIPIFQNIELDEINKNISKIMKNISVDIFVGGNYNNGQANDLFKDLSITPTKKNIDEQIKKLEKRYDIYDGKTHKIDNIDSQDINNVNKLTYKIFRIELEDKFEETMNNISCIALLENLINTHYFNILRQNEAYGYNVSFIVETLGTGICNLICGSFVVISPERTSEEIQKRTEKFIKEDFYNILKKLSNFDELKEVIINSIPEYATQNPYDKLNYIYKNMILYKKNDYKFNTYKKGYMRDITLPKLVKFYEERFIDNKDKLLCCLIPKS